MTQSNEPKGIEARFSISQLEQATGISKDTLRIWERRYGFPLPQRSQRGERMYCSDQLKRLRLIKQLIDSGIRPGKLVTCDLQQLQQLLQTDAPPCEASEEVQELLEIVTSGPDQALLKRMETILQQRGLRYFLTDVIAPMNHAVGTAWLSGKIGILDEHHYAEHAQMVLRTALHSLPQSSKNGRALLTTLPGEQHSIGLLMATCMLALEGVEVLLLGPQTPLEEIVRGAIESECSIVGISCSEYMNRRTVATQLVRLRKLLPDTVAIWAGGTGCSGLLSMPSGIKLFRHLSEIPEAVQ